MTVWSILSSFSKVFERLIPNQLNKCRETKFWKTNLSLVFENYNTQYALLRMAENWKTHFSKRNKIDVIIMKLSNYVTNRYQSCKTGDSFSEWERYILGVLEEFILGPICFKIFINNIYLYINNSELDVVDVIL